MLALGMSGCKTKTIREPAMSGRPEAQQKGSGLAGKVAFNMPQFMLTARPAVEDAEQLQVRELNLYPVTVGEGDPSAATVYITNVEPDVSEILPDYAEFDYSIDKDCEGKAYRRVRTSCSFNAFFTPPACASAQGKVTMRVRARVCAGQNRGGLCGPWSQPSYVKTDLNPPGQNYQDLMAYEKSEEQMLALVNQELLAASGSYADRCNDNTSMSENEQMLCTVANNIANRPYQMCAVYATSLLEQAGEVVKSSGDPTDSGLQLTDGGDQAVPYVLPADVDEAGTQASGSNPYRWERVSNITNSLQCSAAGSDYKWVNRDRACYRKVYEDQNYAKIDKKWANTKSVAGGILALGALTFGGLWAAAEIKEQGSLEFRIQKDATDEHNKRITFLADRNQMDGIREALKSTDLPELNNAQLKGMFDPDPNDNKQLKLKSLDELKKEPEFRSLNTSDSKLSEKYEKFEKLVAKDGIVSKYNSSTKRWDVGEYKLKEQSLLTGMMQKSTTAGMMGIVAAFTAGNVLFWSGYSEYSLTDGSTSAKNYSSTLQAAGEKLADLKNVQCSLGEKLFSYCYQNQN